jgi:hypothetical protein
MQIKRRKNTFALIALAGVLVGPSVGWFSCRAKPDVSLTVRQQLPVDSAEKKSVAEANLQETLSLNFAS